jgi:hypothetical protein
MLIISCIPRINFCDLALDLFEIEKGILNANLLFIKRDDVDPAIVVNESQHIPRRFACPMQEELFKEIRDRNTIIRVLGLGLLGRWGPCCG